MARNRRLNISHLGPIHVQGVKFVYGPWLGWDWISTIVPSSLPLMPNLHQTWQNRKLEQPNLIVYPTKSTFILDILHFQKKKILPCHNFHNWENQVRQLYSTYSTFKIEIPVQRQFKLSGERDQDRPSAFSRESQHARRSTGRRVVRWVLLVPGSPNVVTDLIKIPPHASGTISLGWVRWTAAHSVIFNVTRSGDPIFIFHPDDDVKI